MQSTPPARFPRLRAAIAAVFLSFGGSMLSPAVASGPGEEGGPIKHYEVKEPANIDDAEVMLRNALLKVRSALAAGEWDEIHQASYSLEAANKRIIKTLGEDDGEAEELADRIEIVHLASELEDTATIKAAVPPMVENAQEVLEELDKK